MILETFIAINSGIIASKMIHTKIEEQMNEEIIENGLYHVTSEENADLILESGYIKPSNNFISLGRKKCYFFAGQPSYTDLCKNVASSSTSYEFCAVKIDLKKDANSNEIPKEKAKQILSNFRQRSLNDDSITYRGKCNLKDKCATKVQMVLDLDEKGNIISREKTKAEIENGKYIPSDELTKKLNMEKNNNLMKNMIKSYPNEIIHTYSKIFSKLKSFVNNRKMKTNLLNESSSTLIDNQNVDINKNSFNDDLHKMVNQDNDITVSLGNENSKKIERDKEQSDDTYR